MDLPRESAAAPKAPDFVPGQPSPARFPGRRENDAANVEVRAPNPPPEVIPVTEGLLHSETEAYDAAAAHCVDLEHELEAATVHEIDESGIICRWFDDSDRLLEASFKPEQLIKLPK